MKLSVMLSLGAALCAASSSYAGGCEVSSGAATAAVVELYTSEGCSSCPPADRQLSELRRQLDANAIVVPLALHVSYWDQLGWSDAFAQKIFDARQSELLKKQRNKVVYTPQFFVNGQELRDWRTALPATIRAINAIPAAVTITLKSTPADTRPAKASSAALLLDADVAAADPRTAGALYVALSESGLVSHVLRGENGGATLRHDDTVRLWLGPFPLVRGKIRVQRKISLPAEWQSDRVQAVALVQSADDARVLQAVSTAQCMAATPARRM